MDRQGGTRGECEAVWEESVWAVSFEGRGRESSAGVKSNNDLISISLRNCSKRSFATEILLARAERCEGRGTGDKTGRWT